MHVKYASRQVLYPVPNVFDCTDDVVAARAGRDALRTIAFEDVAVRAVDVAERAVVGAVAVRAVVAAAAVRAVDALRTDALFVVAVRAVVARETVVVAVRAEPVDMFFCSVAVARAVVPVDAAPWERATTVAPDDGEVVFVDCLLIAAASRTAASAQPSHMQPAAIKSKIFFIP